MRAHVYMRGGAECYIMRYLVAMISTLRSPLRVTLFSLTLTSLLSQIHACEFYCCTEHAREGTRARDWESYSCSDLQVQWPPVGILYGPVAVPTGSGRIFLVLTIGERIRAVCRPLNQVVVPPRRLKHGLLRAPCHNGCCCCPPTKGLVRQMPCEGIIAAWNEGQAAPYSRFLQVTADGTGL